MTVAVGTDPSGFTGRYTGGHVRAIHPPRRHRAVIRRFLLGRVGSPPLPRYNVAPSQLGHKKRVLCDHARHRSSSSALAESAPQHGLARCHRPLVVHRVQLPLRNNCDLSIKWSVTQDIPRATIRPHVKSADRTTPALPTPSRMILDASQDLGWLDPHGPADSHEHRIFFPVSNRLRYSREILARSATSCWESLAISRVRLSVGPTTIDAEATNG